MPRQNLLLLLVVVAASALCYERAARNRYAQTLTKAMNAITDNYVDEVEPRVLFEGAMEGMVGKLDPYSDYTSPEEFAQFQQTMDGELTGIGVIVDPDEKSGRLKVLDALVGRPAHLKGIRAGDLLLEINGRDTQELPFREAVKQIRGKPGTKLTVKVQHAGHAEPAVYELERATIPLESVLGDARNAEGEWHFRLVAHPRIGYLRVVSFGERTGEEFRAALEATQSTGPPLEGLIIDLRYNPGGLLTAATEICDALLEDGLIVTTLGRHGVLMERYQARPGTDLPTSVPLVVLVDQLSASASEIVAACLQDHHRAAIAGQRTWGKASVQNVVRLEGGLSAIRLTVGSYHRPSGQKIHKWKNATDADAWGVRPDAGLDVPLTTRENDLIIAARRKRDLLPWADLTAAQSWPSSQPPTAQEAISATLPPAPVPAPDEEQPARPAEALEAEAAQQATLDPVLIDPQLRKAVEHLQSQAAGAPVTSRKA